MKENNDMADMRRNDEPKPIAHNRWLIRVCLHGHRVQYHGDYGGLGGWMHMDADAELCNDPDPRTVLVEKVRRERAS